MRGLAQLVPAQTRLLLDPTGKASHESAEAPQLEAISVPTSSIRRGDILRVLPGERLPVDGIVLSGKCSVDESMLTGEATLVPKSAGQEVRLLLPLLAWIATPQTQGLSGIAELALAPSQSKFS